MIFRRGVCLAACGVTALMVGCSRPVAVSVAIPIPQQPVMAAAVAPPILNAAPARPVIGVIPVSNARNRVRVTLPDGRVIFDRTVTLVHLPDHRKLPPLREGNNIEPGDRYAIGYRFLSSAPSTLTLIEPVAGGFKDYATFTVQASAASIHFKQRNPDSEANSYDCPGQGCGPQTPEVHIEVSRIAP